MKKIILAFLVSIAGVFAFMGLASAHEGSAPEITCESVSSNFTNFPDGENEVTFVVTVNGTTTNKGSSFTGTSGTASANISDLTQAIGELTISAYVEWEADGGGKSETTEVTLTCHEEQPPVVTPPAPEQPKVGTPVKEEPIIRGK